MIARKDLKLEKIQMLAFEYFSEMGFDATKFHSQWSFLLQSFYSNISNDKELESSSRENVIAILESGIDLAKWIQCVLNLDSPIKDKTGEKVPPYYYQLCAEINLGFLDNAINPPAGYDDLLYKLMNRIPAKIEIDNLIQSYIELGYLHNSLLDYALLRLSILSEIYWFISKSKRHSRLEQKSKFIKAILNIKKILLNSVVYLTISAATPYIIPSISMEGALLALLACRIVIEIRLLKNVTPGGHYDDIINSMKEVWSKTSHTTSTFSTFENAMLKSDSAICWPSNIYALIEARKERAKGLILIPPNVTFDSNSL